MSSIINIYGCSERINELNLPKYIKGDSIGLNHLPLYHKTTYWLFMDDLFFGNCVYKREKNKYIPYYPFIPNFEKERDLFGGYTVASFALDFAIKMGYKKAVLYGILDGNYKPTDNDYSHASNMEIEYSHFYTKKKIIISYACMESFKNMIMSYSNPDVREKTIEIEIPYRTFN